MDTIDFILEFKSLADYQQKNVLNQLKKISLSSDYEKVLTSRGDALYNKFAECPHCESFMYTKFGKDKGLRRYKCKNCNRTFTEYTGTWISGLHNKDKIPEFLQAVEAEYSLKKTGKKLDFAVSTAFEWRHKLLSAVEQKEETVFKGVTEADKIHFTHSQKGKKCEYRLPRKRGGGHKKGISEEQATLLTVMDRNGNHEFRFTNMGRITEREVKKAVNHRVNERTILCSDGHSSYKAFTKTEQIEHHILIASKGERVRGIFHIQHINSLHSYIKQFFNYDLRGVSTKYIQKYLNWKKIKVKFSYSFDWIKSVLYFSLLQTKADMLFNSIEKEYMKIFSPTQFTN